ncbi:MAG: hypothetical protein LBJ00_18495 [Planctomycetaceae bacterium]|nr:hypothetical protein [Planctomycetaceae bacterium]
MKFPKWNTQVVQGRSLLPYRLRYTSLLFSFVSFSLFMSPNYVQFFPCGIQDI